MFPRGTAAIIYIYLGPVVLENSSEAFASVISSCGFSNELEFSMLWLRTNIYFVKRAEIARHNIIFLMPSKYLCMLFGLLWVELKDKLLSRDRLHLRRSSSSTAIHGLPCDDAVLSMQKSNVSWSFIWLFLRVINGDSRDC